MNAITAGSSYSVEEIEALYQEKDKQAAQAAAKAEQKAATQSDEGEWTQPEGADWGRAGHEKLHLPVVRRRTHLR